MANLTIDPDRVAPISIDRANGDITAPAAEAIAKGQYVRLNVTTGRLELGNGSTAAEARSGGVAITGALGAGDIITAVRKGELDLGDALTALAYDQDVFLSNTDGTLADTAGTVSLVVGTVVSGNGHTTPDKLLRVDL
jgi:hypothetical protein